MARMQKMPMPKVPAQGSITDKMKKKPLPVRPMPKQVPGGMVKKYQGNAKQGLVQGLNNLKSKKTLQDAKKANPRGGMVSQAGNSKRNERARKDLNPVYGSIQKAYGNGIGRSKPKRAEGQKQKPGQLGMPLGKRLPNRGKLGKPRVTRPVQPPRRGSR